MRVRPFLLLALFARLAAAQSGGARAPGTTVGGYVYDSLARAPLAGAVVQLVAPDNLARNNRTARSDSLGRYTLDDVADGRYLLGFLHPMLDSLGVEPPPREVFVDNHRAVRADLAIPGPARFRVAICGAKAGADSTGVLIGVVRDPRDGAPTAGVAVRGEWLEITFGPGGISRRTPRLTATTGENGWFAMCNVPTAGSMVLRAMRGADSTDLIDLSVPSNGFVRRDLYVGRARATLSGTVVAAAGGKPLAGAQMRIADGPLARSDDKGEWTLPDAPAGTRMFEVRAIGHYPQRFPVNVVDGAPPVRVALSTLKAMLDTVRVMATRPVFSRDRNGFEARRIEGSGRYLTAADIAKRSPTLTSDIFRMVQGVRVERDSSGMEKVLQMRGTFADCACRPCSSTATRCADSRPTTWTIS